MKWPWLDLNWNELLICVWWYDPNQRSPLKEFKSTLKGVKGKTFIPFPPPLHLFLEVWRPWEVWALSRRGGRGGRSWPSSLPGSWGGSTTARRSLDPPPPGGSAWRSRSCRWSTLPEIGLVVWWICSSECLWCCGDPVVRNAVWV